MEAGKYIAEWTLRCCKHYYGAADGTCNSISIPVNETTQSQIIRVFYAAVADPMKGPTPEQVCQAVGQISSNANNLVDFRLVMQSAGATLQCYSAQAVALLATGLFLAMA